MTYRQRAACDAPYPRDNSLRNNLAAAAPMPPVTTDRGSCTPLMIAGGSAAAFALGGHGLQLETSE